MKGLKAVSDKTKKAQEAANGKNIWIPLYYNSANDTVYTTSGKDRTLITHFLNAVDPDEVKAIVKKWLWA